MHIQQNIKVKKKPQLDKADMEMKLLDLFHYQYDLCTLSCLPYTQQSGMSDLDQKSVRLPSNWTYLGLFQIRFQYILALWNKQNVLKYDMIESRIFPFFGQSNLKFL